MEVRYVPVCRNGPTEGTGRRDGRGHGRSLELARCTQISGLKRLLVSGDSAPFDLECMRFVCGEAERVAFRGVRWNRERLSVRVRELGWSDVAKRRS